MKICFLFAAFAATLCAQVPLPPDTVVATANGKGITAAEIRQILDSSPPYVLQSFQQNPSAALADAFVVRHLSGEAEKLKLAEESPWREQLESYRAQILTRAMVTHELNSHPVSAEEIDAYYGSHRSQYEQARIKIISIAFKPSGPAAAPTPQDLKDAARSAMEAAHTPAQRSEAEARTLAADVVKKLRGGADFAQLVEKYSDDKDSKAAGGDYGTVKSTSPYPEDMKKAVFALKPGEVSEPVRQGNAFYIIRLEQKSVQPVTEVREPIILAIRQAHVDQFLRDLQKRFTPKIEKPEFFLQLAPAPKINPPAPGKP